MFSIFAEKFAVVARDRVFLQSQNFLAILDRAYSEPCQISKTKRFAKIVNS